MIVKHLESLHLLSLQQAIELLPNKNSRPARFFNQHDKVSQAWLSALPGPFTHIPDPEFTQAMAWFFMCPSPACSPYVGSLVCGKPLDAYGEVLMCAPLPFDSWRVRHDKIKSEIRAIGVDSGVIVEPEPFGVFSPFIPAAALAEDGQLHRLRERQGLVPDLLITYPKDHGPNSISLGEIKLISAGLTHYRGSRKSVDVRADKLPKEYSDKARRIDQQYRDLPQNQDGPLVQKLKSFGDLKCLVVGQLGECSQHLQELLIRFAEEKVANDSRAAGLAIDKDKVSLKIQQYRRRLSVCTIKAQSSCLLSRVGHFTEGARQAAQRRAVLISREEASRNELRAHFTAYTRGRGLRKIGLLHI